MRNLGSTRKTPINQLKYGQFSTKYLGEIRNPKELVEFIIFDGSKKPHSTFIPLERVEIKIKSWEDQGVNFKQIKK